MVLLEGRTQSISPHPGGTEQLEAVERIRIFLLACVQSESWSWHFHRVGGTSGVPWGFQTDVAQKVPDVWLFLQVAGALTVGFCFPFPVQCRGQQPPVPVHHASLLERRRQGESLSHPGQDSTAQASSVTPSAASFVVPLMSEGLPAACPQSLNASIPLFLLPQDAPAAPGSVV